MTIAIVSIITLALFLFFLNKFRNKALFYEELSKSLYKQLKQCRDNGKNAENKKPERIAEVY